MTDLEERVRDALRARAEGFTASPDAWQRTVTRAGRRRARRHAGSPAGRHSLARFTPLAAAAAVVVIGAGTAVVAQTGGFANALRHVGLGPSVGAMPQGTPSSSGGQVPGSLCAWPQLPKAARRAAVGVPVSAKITLDGVTTWWARVPESYVAELNDTGHADIHTDLIECQDQAHGGHGGFNGHGGFTDPLGRGQLVRITPGPGDADGISVTSVTSVEADLANGRVVQGAVTDGRGFPYAVWWVDYPQKISAVLVFRNADGQVVAQLSEPYTPPVNPLKHPVLLTPSDVLCDTAPARQAPSQLVRVRQVMDGVKVWTYVQFTHPAHSSPPVPVQLCEAAGVVGDSTSYTANASLPAGEVATAVNQLNQTSTVSGLAAADVSSVTAVLGDGKTYTGTLVSGRGFPDQVWLVSYPTKDPATVIFRNAAGQQVAVLHTSANVWPVT
jgi:hypothetical protein